MLPASPLRRLGLIQPGRIGDVIICLPIARWYAQRGYTVIWPVADYIASQMQGYIDYVHFVPVPDLDCARVRNIVYANCNTVIDLAFCFPNSTPFNDGLYTEHSQHLLFDEIKYAIAGVPFEEKWRLSFHRNPAAEQALYQALAPEAPYTLVHVDGSTQSARFTPPTDARCVYVTPRSASIFDWCGLIEKAQSIIAVDSSLANLVEQSGLNHCAKQLIKRVPDIRPTYRDHWQFID